LPYIEATHMEYYSALTFTTSGRLKVNWVNVELLKYLISRRIRKRNRINSKASFFCFYELDWYKKNKAFYCISYTSTCKVHTNELKVCTI
jgi:hypothetical protein